VANSGQFFSIRTLLRVVFWPNETAPNESNMVGPLLKFDDKMLTLQFFYLVGI